MNPLLEATNKMMDALLPTEHAKKCCENMAIATKDREKLMSTVIRECGGAIRDLSEAIRSPRWCRLDIQSAIEQCHNAMVAAKQLDPEE